MIFITGCNGLVGSFIARKLVAENKKVMALKRKNSDLSLIHDIKDKIEWIEGDVLDISLMDEATQKADSVIHTAAIVSFSPGTRDLMYKINVEGTRNLVNASLKNNIKRFCFISSIAAIGRKKDETNVNEECVWEDSENNTHYAKSKYLSELEVWRGSEEGLPAFIVNPSVVLGPGNWENGSTKLFKYVWDQNLFYRKGELNFVDARDLADIVYKLLISDVSEERFILNSAKISYQELFQKIAGSFHKKAPSIEANSFMTALAWRVEYIKSLLTGKDPILTRETAQLSGLSYTYENAKIRQSLGYTFRTIDDTIQWTCKELANRPVNK